MASRSSPEEIPALKDVPLADLSAGGDHSAALCRAGDVYTWGSNGDGQLGLGDVDSSGQVSPQRIRSQEKFIGLSCGYHHSAFLTGIVIVPAMPRMIP